MTEQVVYAYAVARDSAELAEALSGLEGVARSPVHLVRGGQGGELVAAVSPVDAADFGEVPLRRHLEDLTWLEAVARAHHGVIEVLTERTTVLPLRLATVYLDDDRVRGMLDRRGDVFADRLARLAAHVEWGVKLYVEPPAEEPPPAVPASDDAGPGRSYLRRRRAERHARDDVYRTARSAAESVAEAARRYAVEHARHRVQQGELARGPGENVTNDAYLVPLERGEEFRAEVRRAAEGLSGIRVEVTGPWAPYSFAAPVETHDEGREGAPAPGEPPDAPGGVPGERPAHRGTQRAAP
ncbi:GvpL/GvpF family gas vesicle protein [Streptomyces sp. NPDC001780]